MSLYSLYILVGLVLLGIQAHPLLPFAQQGIRPELVLVLVVYLGTRPEVARVSGALLASLLGYFCAAFSSGPFGLQACLYLAFFVCIDLLKNVFDLQSIYFQMLLVVVCTLLEGVLTFLLCWGFHGYPLVLEPFKTILPKQLALTAAVAPGTLLLLHYMTNRLAQNNSIPILRLFSRGSSAKPARS
jgi:cell shape-determining protein MreD